MVKFVNMNAYQIALNAIIGCFAVLAGVIIMFSEESLTIDEFVLYFTNKGSIVFMVAYLFFETYKRLKLKTDQHTVLKIFYKKLILE